LEKEQIESDEPENVTTPYQDATVCNCACGLPFHRQLRRLALRAIFLNDLLMSEIGIHHHRFGVNYTPTRSWWYCWNDFDADAIAADLDAIALLGADHIRIMLIWPFFQPNPKVVSQAHLDRLNTLMTLAAERKLDVCVTLFVGWLSGFEFKPPFQLDESFYQLSESRIPQEHYVRRVAETLKPHDNFLGFDLGNELNVCWFTPQHAIANAWSSHMLSLAEACLPDGIHVNGVDHNPWLASATFSPASLATTQKIIPLHCWTFFTGALRRAGEDCFDPRCVRLPAAMAALARSYADDAGKPIWLQEYGMSEDWTDPQNIPRFLHDTTQDAIQSGVSWFTWWCSHDLDPQYEFGHLEYSLGLITHDQKIKPQGQVFKELADAYRGREVTINRNVDIPAPPPTRNEDSSWQWIEEWMGMVDG
jgi:endo-1,4-beta-mannosidase